MTLKTNDPTQLGVAIFDNTGSLVKKGEIGETTTTINGLKSGLSEPAGHYKVAFTDGTNYGPQVALDGFTTLSMKPSSLVASNQTGSAQTGLGQTASSVAAVD
ncbi:hypothetical protein [Secundilactobacillus kimchicus]|uniref:hypothetical protein n=1 Tax=Secundilactobacillus kimchicus TaxID=528209 RepID=UPI0024A90025|nr:hypothetical protein [Secundilactobacillus kimchicus]